MKLGLIITGIALSLTMAAGTSALAASPADNAAPTEKLAKCLTETQTLGSSGGHTSYSFACSCFVDADGDGVCDNKGTLTGSCTGNVNSGNRAGNGHGGKNH